MSQPWYPRNFEEACKRNAGRRKLHRRTRRARADRIVRILAAMEVVPELRTSVYGRLSLVAQALNRSKATVSRDCKLARLIHRQFLRMFGRAFQVHQDQVIWSWDSSHYGFVTSERRQAGFSTAAGNFPFSTRAVPCVRMDFHASPEGRDPWGSSPLKELACEQLVTPEQARQANLY
jgi:hypothetical protein